MSDLANNEQEELALLHVVVLALPLALAAIGGWFAAQSGTAAAWLINHQILVEPAGALLPITEHAGIDLVRVILGLAIVCLVGFGYARFRPHPKPATR